MTPHTIKIASRDDDVGARERYIQNRILDGIEETLDELAQPDTRRAAIDRIVQARCAALRCRHATCRRARSCRSQPCRVP